MNREITKLIDTLLDIAEEWNIIEDCRNPNCEAYSVIERGDRLYKAIAIYIVNNIDIEKLKNELMVEEL